MGRSLIAPLALFSVCAVALYWPVFSLDFAILDAPGDTMYSFIGVKKFIEHPSLDNLRVEKDPFRITPVYYLTRFAVTSVLGFHAPRHHAVQIAMLIGHLALLTWFFRRVTGNAWWAAPAVFYYLLFLPDDYNSTAYNFYTLFTIEPMMILMAGGYCLFASEMASRKLAGARRIAVLIGMLLWAMVILFTKETAVFYSVGILALGWVLWRRGCDRVVSAWTVIAYAIASLAFIAVYFYVVGTGHAWSSEVQPGDSTGARAFRIAGIFLNGFGPLLLLIPFSYAVGFTARKGRGGGEPRLNLDMDLVGWALFFPPLIQMALWPNFQPRLLLPEGFVLSAILGLSVWRLCVLKGVCRGEAGLAANSGGRDARPPFGGARMVKLLNVAVIFAGVFSAWYGVNALMSYSNFRLLFRTNETARVRAYTTARDMLAPSSRLYVAILKGDQNFYEIGWRLSFFDHKPNQVLELQPDTTDKPRAGDVIIYHPGMARVKVEGASIEKTPIKESGRSFTRTGFGRFVGAVASGENPFATRGGGNEYVVMKVRGSSS